MMALLISAIAATLVAVMVVAVPLFRDPSGRAPVAALLTALVIPITVVLLYAGISSYPWGEFSGAGKEGGRIAGGAVEPRDSTPLRERIVDPPVDAAGWMRVGDGYIGEERFEDARDAYREAMALADAGDSEVRLAFAEASILADRNALTGEAGQIIDEVLLSDPVNPKALWYGGMAALGRGDIDGARNRWSKLLELSPPPQVRQIIEQQLAQLGAASAPAPDSPTAGEDMTRIPVRVAVKPDLASRIAPGASLFLIARAPGGAGPPLAVVRRESAALPLDIEISDADSMVPGKSLAGLAEVKLTARIANDGEALAASGDVFGEAIWRPGSSAPFQIVMDQVVQ